MIAIRSTLCKNCKISFDFVNNVRQRTQISIQIAEIVAMLPENVQRPSDASGLETSIVNTSLLDQSQFQEMKKREAKVQKVLESYEMTFRNQAEDLESYKTKIKSLEEKTHFEDRARELQIQLENLKAEVKEKYVGHQLFFHVNYTLQTQG